MDGSVVIMGVAGCGKSSLAVAIAAAEGVSFVEGDQFHPESSREKMRGGIALTDADRAGWLDTLGRMLSENPQGVVLTCSALKRAYRDRLRVATPGLRFVHLEITPEESRARVCAREAHYFSASLVDSQFAALEPPDGEPGVLSVDATAPLVVLQGKVCDWLRGEARHRAPAASGDKPEY